jgi:hypothetical protein
VWRLSLLNEKGKPFELPMTKGDMMVRYAVVAAPIRFSELFNFKGMLHEKSGTASLVSLEAYLERWKHVPAYHHDLQAPTAGNVRNIVQKIADLAVAHPQGIWHITDANQIED